MRPACALSGDVANVTRELDELESAAGRVGTLDGVGDGRRPHDGTRDSCWESSFRVRARRERDWRCEGKEGEAEAATDTSLRPTSREVDFTGFY